MANVGLRNHAKYVEKMIVKGETFNKTMKYGFPLVSRKTTQTSNQIIDEVQGAKSRLVAMSDFKQRSDYE